MFYVGQKVVCINVDEYVFRIPGKEYNAKSGFFLVKGAVYTIASFHKHPYEGECIKLCELADRGARDHGYNIKRFRPLVENKTDISIFNSILNNPLIKIENDQFDKVEA